MTNSEPPLSPPTVYVWVWLPGTNEPVVAGRLDDRGPVATFAYGRSYLDNPDAVALYLPDLPLEPGETLPASGTLPGCIADSGASGVVEGVAETGAGRTNAAATIMAATVAASAALRKVS